MERKSADPACLLDGLDAACSLTVTLQSSPGSIFTAQLRYETIAFDVWFPPGTDDRYVLRVLRRLTPAPRRA